MQSQENMPAEAAPGGPDGFAADLRMRVVDAPCRLSADNLRDMLDNCLGLLWQISRVATYVVESIGAGFVRDVVAAEAPVIKGTVLEDGSIQQTTAQRAGLSTATGRDHRKEPRGRKHPLLVFLALGVQAASLFQRICAGAYPEFLNVESLQAKQQRREAAQQEREFRDMMNMKLPKL